VRLRHLIFILVIILILFILRPRQVWAEVKRIHRQWDLLLYLLVTVIIVYLAYGLFSIGGGETSGWPF
jgi:glycopeptide antibiotics resistance protein